MRLHGILLLLAGWFGFASHFAEVLADFGLHARARHGARCNTLAGEWLAGSRE